MQSFIFLASLVSELVGGGGASCYKNKAFQHSGTIIVSFFLGGGHYGATILTQKMIFTWRLQQVYLRITPESRMFLF